MEAIHYGIPILGIPLYGSNYNNLRKVEAKGFGLILEKKDLNAESLYGAMRKLLDNPKYKIAKIFVIYLLQTNPTNHPSVQQNLPEIPMI